MKGLGVKDVFEQKQLQVLNEDLFSRGFVGYKIIGSDLLIRTSAKEKGLYLVIRSISNI